MSDHDNEYFIALTNRFYRIFFHNKTNVFLTDFFIKFIGFELFMHTFLKLIDCHTLGKFFYNIYYIDRLVFLCDLILFITHAYFARKIYYSSTFPYNNDIIEIFFTTEISNRDIKKPKETLYKYLYRTYFHIIIHIFTKKAIYLYKRTWVLLNKENVFYSFSGLLSTTGTIMTLAII